MIKFRCIECQHKIAVPNDYEGKYVKCPACRAPTLVRQEPIDVKMTAAVTAAPEAAAKSTRQAAPVSAARPAHIPEARPVRSAAAGLATSQASELVKALDPGNPPSTASLPEEVSQQLEEELAANGALAASAAQQGHAATAGGHVAHAKPPRYLFMQGLGLALLAIGAAAAMLWLVGLVVTLTRAGAADALPMARGPALAVTFGGSFVGVLAILAAGQALLALRDIARHSWYQKETAALLRQVHAL